jgi:hypothetical protein
MGVVAVRRQSHWELHAKVLVRVRYPYGTKCRPIKCNYMCWHMLIVFVRLEAEARAIHSWMKLWFLFAELYAGLVFLYLGGIPHVYITMQLLAKSSVQFNSFMFHSRSHQVSCQFKPRLISKIDPPQHSIIADAMSSNVPEFDSDLCTLSTCGLEYANFTYIPSLAGNITYLALFVLFIGAQTVLSVRYKTWGFFVGMFGGLALEIIGYAGRVQLHYNPFPFNPFLQYVLPRCS